MKTSTRLCVTVACAVALAAPFHAQVPSSSQATPNHGIVKNTSAPLPRLRSNRSELPREQIVKPARPVVTRTGRSSTKQANHASPAANPTSGNVSAAPAGGHSIAEALATGQSSPWAIAVGLTLLTLVPAVLLAMTPLVRLLVVFHFLRQALGTQTAPSNQILMALGLMMTWFLMQPVITQIDVQAVEPYRAGMMSGEDALAHGTVPVKQYMLRYARDKDLELFASASQPTRLQHREDAPMQVVVPAYMLSELKSGFQIGAILFLPFLLIDLVIASVTTSIGMLQMPPTVISTPVKILLFVVVDGWHLLASSLLKSF